MNEHLEALIARNHGYFTRAQALHCDLEDRDLGAALRSGLLTRLRHGAYATSELVDALDPVDLHVLTARAVLNQQRGPVALTGISAAAVHGLALWGQDLCVVHLVRLDRGSPRRECGVQHHVVADDVSSQIEVVNGLPVVNMARAVWEVASSSGMEVACVRLTRPCICAPT